MHRKSSIRSPEPCLKEDKLSPRLDYRPLTPALTQFHGRHKATLDLSRRQPSLRLGMRSEGYEHVDS